MLAVPAFAVDGGTAIVGALLAFIDGTGLVDRVIVVVSVWIVRFGRAIASVCDDVGVRQRDPHQAGEVGCGSLDGIGEDSGVGQPREGRSERQRGGRDLSRRRSREGSQLCHPPEARRLCRLRSGLGSLRAGGLYDLGEVGFGDPRWDDRLGHQLVDLGDQLRQVFVQRVSRHRISGEEEFEAGVYHLCECHVF